MNTVFGFLTSMLLALALVVPAMAANYDPVIKNSQVVVKDSKVQRVTPGVALRNAVLD